jgi:ferredoxin
MRVEVDLTRCQGYGNCVSAAPAIFELGENDLVLILRQPAPEDEDATRAAARLCPVSAITVTEG